MDFVNILLFCLMSIIVGAVLMLLIQYYAFVRYFDANQKSEDAKPGSCSNQRFQLPDVSVFKVIYYSLPEVIRNHFRMCY